MSFHRTIFQTAIKHLEEPRRFIQVLSGPRQVGKTTLAEQLVRTAKCPVYYASADEATLQDRAWIVEQWQLARFNVRMNNKNAVLILDEVQKISQWSETVKRLWDEDTRSRLRLKVFLLGSSPLLMQRGLTESLAGRFEMLPVTHWSYLEMQKAFGWTLDEYIYFGGYPGSADLIQDENRWRNYILDSLVETTLSRDILLLTPIQKPALLRRLFYLSCHYSGQILSFQKMLGQLQDVGNTTTLSHYLELLAGAGMVTGIWKFAGQTVRQRGSSPKLQVLNTALFSSQQKSSFKECKQDGAQWGRLVESAVGAYLLNSMVGKSIEIFYWRERNKEVDFILKQGGKLVAIEVKSGQKKEALSGLKEFHHLFKPKTLLVVGEGGMSFKDFFTLSVEDLFK